MTRNSFVYGIASVIAAFVLGCAATQQVVVKKEEVKCGFLGSDCAKLTAGAKGQAALRYINTTASWTQYDKILVESVTFWGTDTTKVSAADQQALTDYFYQMLREEFGKKFQLVDQAGPGVMKLQVALTDAEGATPGLRTISTIVPTARAVNALKYAATGTYSFVGGAQAEAKLTDATTGELLGEWIDRRVGGGSLEAAAQWKWGDAENAMKSWATQLAERLSSWTSGMATPS